MRITLVGGNLADGGGVNRVIRDLSTILTALPAKVRVVGVGTSAKPSYPFDSSVPVETARGGMSGWLKAVASIRRQKPDYVIGFWTQSNIILIAGLLFSGIKVIAAEHGSWDFQPRRVRALRWLFYKLAWRVVVVNQTDLDHYVALGNVRLIPNPVPLVDAPVARERDKLIIAVGHLVPNKGFLDAIEAFARSGLDQRGWKLIIVGAGPEEFALKAAIEQFGLKATNIHPPTADLSLLNDRASLILVTSRREVFSLVLAEAMASGVVPVAYAADGPSFVLQDFPDCLVPVGDVAGLGEQISRLAAGQISHSLRQALHGSIERRFAPAVIAREWAKLLRDRP